jgi:hypothetical protein
MYATVNQSSSQCKTIIKTKTSTDERASLSHTKTLCFGISQQQKKEKKNPHDTHGCGDLFFFFHCVRCTTGTVLKF